MVFQVREAVPYQILFNNIKVSDFTYRLTLGTLKGIRVEKNTLKICSPPPRRLLKSSCRSFSVALPLNFHLLRSFVPYSFSFKDLLV